MSLLRPTPWHDVAGGVLLAAAALAAGPRARRRFAVGTAVGLAWELPFAALARGPRPLFTDVQPWPLPKATQPLVHALWDGGLLLLGAALTGRRDLSPLRWSDLAVQTAWGAGQELAAELVGNGRVWRWHGPPYNPVLFRRGDVEFTLLPQLVWTIAPAVFHTALARLERPKR